MPTWVRSYVVDPLERAASTFVQQFVLMLLPAAAVMVAFNASQWEAAADAAGFAAIASLVTSVLTFWVPPQTALVDLVLRTVKTFLQSFAGSMAASQVTSVVHFDWQVAASLALAVASAAFLKGLAAMAAPWSPGNASLLSNPPSAA